MKTLRDSRVLITGGARGIGFAMAEAFAREGAEIILCDVQGELLEESYQRLVAAGYRARRYRFDVTDLGAIRDLTDWVHREVGTLHVLVNNAGVVFGGPFLDQPLDKHLLTYKVNIEGVVAMTHAFLGDLIAATEGHLVNVASASGFIGLPQGSTYASSKWAVIGFSESIRQELQQSHAHVGVTTVCPSYVSTGMFEGARAPILTNFLTPKSVAEKTVAAVKKNKPFVLEPWLVKLTPALMGMLPTFLSDKVADLTGASKSMHAWQGHGK
jgi:all-trans-retinol dehydrogenase (NAD+)